MYNSWCRKQHLSESPKSKSWKMKKKIYFQVSWAALAASPKSARCLTWETLFSIHRTLSTLLSTTPKTDKLLEVSFFKLAFVRRALFRPSKVYISTTIINYSYVIFASMGIWSSVPWRHVDRKQVLYLLGHEAPLLEVSFWIWSAALKLAFTTICLSNPPPTHPSRSILFGNEAFNHLILNYLLLPLKTCLVFKTLTLKAVRHVTSKSRSVQWY